MPNFCSNCGKSVQNNWNFCPYCNKNLFQTGIPTPSQEINPYHVTSITPYPMNEQESQPLPYISGEAITPPKKRLSKNQIKAIIIVGVIIIAGIITGVSIYFGLNKVRTIHYYVNFGDNSKSYTITLPRSTYDYYTNRVHPTHSYYDYDLVVFAIESYCTPNDEVIIDLAQDIRSGCNNPNDDEEVVNALLSFSQGIIYENENGDKCQYPLETIFNRGDCEDLCVFFGSLVEAAGYQAILMCVEIYDYDTYEWIGHVITGVYLNFVPIHNPGNSSWYYDVSGYEYWICETTDQGWMVGELPVLDPSDLNIFSYADVD